VVALLSWKETQLKYSTSQHQRFRQRETLRMHVADSQVREATYVNLCELHPFPRHLHLPVRTTAKGKAWMARRTFPFLRQQIWLIHDYSEQNKICFNWIARIFWDIGECSPLKDNRRFYAQFSESKIKARKKSLRSTEYQTFRINFYSSWTWHLRNSPSGLWRKQVKLSP
jgi:hypothetical protein